MSNPPEAPLTHAPARDELSRKVESIKIESRHLASFTLTNDSDGTKWKPVKSLRDKWTWKRVE